MTDCLPPRDDASDVLPELPPCGVAAALRIALKLAVLLVLAWLIHLMFGWVMAQTATLESASHLRIGLLLLMLLAYATLIAVPFVPGVELGISLMMIEGGSIAPFVYLATVLGLMMAFLVGAKLPYISLHRILADLHMRRACAILERIEPLDQKKRLALLRRRLPDRIAPLAIKHRYLALALLINLPGSSVIGGGGGIMFFSGLSRLFSPLWAALTVVLAVAPVPVMVWFFDLKLPVPGL